MCAAYWNLDVPGLKCPKCGSGVNPNFQTHFNGESGDCSNYYKLNEPIPNLDNMTGKMSELGGGYFNTECEKCDKFLDYDAVIVEGAVVEVILREKDE